MRGETMKLLNDVVNSRMVIWSLRYIQLDGMLEILFHIHLEQWMKLFHLLLR